MTANGLRSKLRHDRRCNPDGYIVSPDEKSSWPSSHGKWDELSSNLSRRFVGSTSRGEPAVAAWREARTETVPNQ